MRSAQTTAPDPASRPRPPWLPPGADPLALGLLLAGFAALYLPTYLTLARQVWPADEQGQGPIVLLVGAWLLYARRIELARLQPGATPWAGLPLLLFGLLLYIVGRSQFILVAEVVSQNVVIAGLVMCFYGAAGLRAIGFPLLFLCFMVPLPASLVAEVTGPLKSAVSAVAADALYGLGYPVGRAGVILSVGPYQLLVADACAGLSSIFTLEALGLLYMHLMRDPNPLRNLLLAVLIVPIAFLANVARVMTLVLVTYHFGDAAGQGFAHGFAGMLLFGVGLLLMLAADRALRALFGRSGAARRWAR